MSTPADILRDIAAFLQALSELFATDTVQALAQLARDFGIGAPLRTGLQLLSRVLGLVRGWLQSLEQVATIPRFLAALEPALVELGDLTHEVSGEELRQSGLEVLAPVVDSAGALLVLLDKLRRGARVVLEGVLPARELAALRASVVGLEATLDTLRQQLDGPPSVPDALAAGGSA